MGSYFADFICHVMFFGDAGVFGVYGIKVDPRHLGLIADYMTFDVCAPFLLIFCVD
jgi:hypothetical protein